MPRPCIVTLTDLRGIRHVAEVSAESDFEAAALAVQAFRQCQFVEDVGPATRLEIEVPSATTRHVVTVGQVLRWTEGGATSPGTGWGSIDCGRCSKHRGNKHATELAY